MKLLIPYRRVLLFVALIAAALGCFRAFTEIDTLWTLGLPLLGFLFFAAAAGVFHRRPADASLRFLNMLCLVALAILVLLGVLAQFVTVSHQ